MHNVLGTLLSPEVWESAIFINYSLESGEIFVISAAKFWLRCTQFLLLAGKGLYINFVGDKG